MEVEGKWGTEEYMGTSDLQRSWDKLWDKNVQDRKAEGMAITVNS